jgi:hypothetical protein
MLHRQRESTHRSFVATAASAARSLGAEMYPAAAELADTDPDESVVAARLTRTSQS